VAAAPRPQAAFIVRFKPERFFLNSQLPPGDVIDKPPCSSD
jgi:hypothetical protein